MRLEPKQTVERVIAVVALVVVAFGPLIFNDYWVDAILTPATPSSAFGIADQDMANDPVKMYLNDIFTVTVNMAGLPGIAVPAGLDHKGLPLGLQLIGKAFDEETLFQTAHVIEQAAGRFTPTKWW